MKTTIKGLLALPLLLAGFSSSSEEAVQVGYPEGYRDWTHVKSAIIHENHPIAETFGGLHHIYANDVALEAMKNGRAYPDGSVLVFDLFEIDAMEEDGLSLEGPRIRKDVMQKNASLWVETGGWGYETFFGADEKRIITDMMASCHGCHYGAEETDYVFSQYRD